MIFGCAFLASSVHHRAKGYTLENMTLSEQQIDLISRYKSSYREGLTSQEASERRSDGLNTVAP